VAVQLSHLSSSLLPLARKLHRRVMVPLGKYRVRQIGKEGLPLSFHRPLQFLFAPKLSGDEQKVVDQVEAIRAKVAERPDLFPVAFADTADPTRTAAQIAYRSSVTPEWGTFLYLCAESFRVKTILELGSCAGISGCYLASSKYCTSFTTIEKSSPLASLAEANVRQISSNATVINALFDDALDDLLPSINHAIDLAYIDGHHQYEPTLHYLRRLTPHLRKGSLVVFDDIHWSQGMWEAWKMLRAWKGFSYTIDVGRFGLGLWDESVAQPTTYNLAW